MPSNEKPTILSEMFQNQEAQFEFSSAATLSSETPPTIQARDFLEIQLKFYQLSTSIIPTINEILEENPNLTLHSFLSHFNSPLSLND